MAGSVKTFWHEVAVARLTGGSMAARGGGQGDTVSSNEDLSVDDEAAVQRDWLPTVRHGLVGLLVATVFTVLHDRLA